MMSNKLCFNRFSLVCLVMFNTYFISGMRPGMSPGMPPPPGPPGMQTPMDRKRLPDPRTAHHMKV
jgi:hypothetical protein